MNELFRAVKLEAIFQIMSHIPNPPPRDMVAKLESNWNVEGILHVWETRTFARRY